jgi:undecaprenyl-diphosphatase
MDYRLEQWINGPAGSHPAIDAVMIAAARWGEALFISVVVLWFVAGWLLGRSRDRQGAITALVAAGLALLANQAIIHLWARPRPFVAHPDSVHRLLAHTSDPSFPSDHASPAFAIGFVLVWFHRRAGAAVLSLATLMCVARVYVGDHYPGDVGAGAVVGLVVAVLLLTVLNPVMEIVERVTGRILSALHLPARTARREYPARVSIEQPSDEPATVPGPVPAGRTEQ